ncbi:hypothetical protein B0F90DRAFT_1278050 [Multifurca ochricompacta]|uniref:Uncharacterized protein n=1 Tax=Multifurca ochricompacta TaxID=376703 RepID=A0AAD4LXT2_9AGAM|nr:hypothetical protein B0F90DRAFT_1278050 [Multifurca ochricompacta]
MSETLVCLPMCRWSWQPVSDLDHETSTEFERTGCAAGCQPGRAEEPRRNMLTCWSSVHRCGSLFWRRVNNPLYHTDTLYTHMVTVSPHPESMTIGIIQYVPSLHYRAEENSEWLSLREHNPPSFSDPTTTGHITFRRLTE